MGVTKKRRQFSAKQRARIALEAVREQSTMSQIASAHSCHPTQITRWKKQLIEGAPGLFEDDRSSKSTSNSEKLVGELYEQIGRLKMEFEWLKKKFS